MEEVEIWKDIPEYEGLYQVSNLGRIKSLYFGKERIMKQSKDKQGYCCISLYKDCKIKYFLVHRLIGLVFIPNDNPTEKIEINHKDENKENNTVTNLCWVTPKENCNWGTRNKRRIEKKSIPILQYDLNNNLIREWGSSKLVNKELNINNSHIIACCKGKRKTCGDFIWKYKENNSNLVIS